MKFPLVALVLISTRSSICVYPNLHSITNSISGSVIGEEDDTAIHSSSSPRDATSSKVTLFPSQAKIIKFPKS